MLKPKANDTEDNTFKNYEKKKHNYTFDILKNWSFKVQVIIITNVYQK